MAIQHLLDNYTSSVDLISFFCCMTLLIIIRFVLFYSNDKKFSTLKKAVYFIMAGSAVNITFSYVVGNYPDNKILIFALRSMYHICFMCCLYLYVIYIKSMLEVKGGIVKRITIITRVIFVIAMIFDVLSPITKFGFYEEDGLWYDPLVSPYNMFYVYAVFLMFVMLVYYSDRLIRSVRYCLMATEAIVVLIMARSAIENSNSLTSFTYILPVLVMMILIHSKPFDDKTGALGTESFDSYVNRVARKKTPIDYMVLKLDIKGNSDLNVELGKALNSFWFKSFKNALLFRVEYDMFVLAIPRTERNGDTEKKILALCREDFQKYYCIYQIKYKIIGLFNIDFIQSDIDIKNMINYMIITMDDNTISIADDEKREYLRHLHDVMENLIDISNKENLNDERVLAYCQPIRNMKTGKFDTAEALMRLSIPGNSYVMPSVFIPLAEYHNLIHPLTKIMLNKVCKQIKQLEDEGYEFNRISVNFAASEIRKENFCDEVLNIIRSNGVAPEKIGIEITESQNEGDFRIVKEKMKILREAGMTLYLDDIGTGYSNLDRIVRYDVDVVKFDRFFLLEAEKDKKVVNMMKHLAAAFKDLNYSLLYEGVESNDNEDLCMKCNADYIQGFKYSKPVPIEEMRNFFTQK